MGFLLPLPDLARAALLRIAGLLQGHQGVALVLDRARQRAEFLRSFNQALLDAMELGLVPVGPDLRVQHTNRWMTGRFGAELAGRTCLATYLGRPEQCAACPWRDGEPTSRELAVDGPAGRKFLLHALPLAAPDGSTLLLELLRDSSGAGSVTRKQPPPGWLRQVRARRRRRRRGWRRRGSCPRPREASASSRSSASGP